MVLENINKDENPHDISVKELADALQPRGFLDNTENIDALAKHLQENEEKIAESLKNNLNEHIDTIQNKQFFSPEELKVISLRNRLDPNPDKKEKLTQQLDMITNKIAKEVSTTIGKNKEGNINYYTAEQVMHFQTYANIKQDRYIKIDGQRGDNTKNGKKSGLLFDLSALTEDQQTTNLRIYRKELAARGVVVDIRSDENLLSIPNIDNMLATIPDVAIQQSIFKEFTDIFLKIRRNGFSFESKIGGERLEALLILMINKEKIGDMSTKNYYDNEAVTNKYETMGQYLAASIKELQASMLAQNKQNIENNNALQTINASKKILEDIASKEEEIKELNSPIDEIEKEKAILKDQLDSGEIDSIQYSKAIKELRERRHEYAYEHIISDQNINKIDKLRYEIIEKKLDLYTLKPNTETLTMICLELKQYFPDHQIKWFLNQDHVQEKYNINYKRYEKVISDRENENIELHKQDEVNDILMQYNGSGILISTINEEEYKEHFPVEFGLVSSNKGLSDRLGENNMDVQVPSNLYKIKLNQSSSPIYVKNSNFEKMPTEKENKKVIVIPNADTRKSFFAGNTALRGTNDVSFAYASKDEKGNLIIEDTQGNVIRTITPEEQSEASRSLHMVNLDVYDHDMQDTLRSFELANTALDPLNKALENYQSGGVFATLFSSEEEKPKGISDDEVKFAIKQLKTFARKISVLENQENINNWKTQRDKLKEIQAQSGGLKNQFEQGIDNMIATFDAMISFFEVKNGTSQARELKNQIAQIDTNDSPRESLKDFVKKDLLKYALAIAGAVAAILLAKVSAGTSLLARSKFVGGLRGVSVLGTVGGMAGYRAGTYLNEARQNTFNPRYADGSIRFEDPTDIEQVTRGQIAPGDFFARLSKEFAMGTITTMTFIKAGQLLGKAMAKSTNPNIVKFQKRTQKVMLNGESHNAVNTFGNQFRHEFGQEVWQESLQGTGENIHPVLGGLFNIMACLSGPSYANISNSYRIAGGKSRNKPETGENITQFSYDATKGDLTELTNYLEGQFDLVEVKNGKIIARKKLQEKISTQDGRTIDTQVFEYVPSQASSNTNNLAATILADYNVQVDHNATDKQGNPINQILLPSTQDQAKIQEIQAKLLIADIGTITQHSDGLFSLHTSQETIHFTTETKKNSKLKETERIQQKEEVSPQNSEQFVKSLEDSQHPEKQISQESVKETTKTKEKVMNFMDKLTYKLINSGLLSAKDPAEIASIISANVSKGVMHYAHELGKFATFQTFDTLKSLHRFLHMRATNKPGQEEAGKIAVAKWKSWSINLVKLVTFPVVAKFTIDPMLFTKATHLTADTLAQHSGTLQKFLYATFETLESTYHVKNNNRKIYDPKVVFEHGSLDETARRAAFIKELGLDTENPQHLELVDKLMEAHAVGEGQTGKDPRFSAGVYNYTNAQIKAKYELIKPYIDKGLITHQQVKKLFDLGYLGKTYTEVSNETIEKVEFVKDANTYLEVEGARERTERVKQKTYGGVMQSAEQLYQQAGQTFSETKFMRDLEHELKIEPGSELYNKGFRKITIANNITRGKKTEHKHLQATLTDDAGNKVEVTIATQKELQTKEQGIELENVKSYEEVLQHANLTAQELQEAEALYEQETGEKIQIFKKTEKGYTVIADEIAKLRRVLPTSPETAPRIQKTRAKIGKLLKFVYDESANLDGFETSVFKLSQVDTEIVASLKGIREKIQPLKEKKEKEKLSEKEEEALKELEKSLLLQKQIIDTDITLKTYEGIRQKLKLTIEEQLQYLRKVLKNSGIESISEFIDVNDSLDFYLGRPKEPYKYESNKELSSETAKKNFEKYKTGEQVHDEVMGNLIAYLDSFNSGTILDGANTENILWMCSEMITQAENANLFKEDSDGNQLTETQKKEKLFGLVQHNMNNVLHQEVYNLSYLAGSDHGINHIVNGNMKSAMTLTNQLGEDVTAKEKLMVLQMIADHDIGYAHKLLDRSIITEKDSKLNLVEKYFPQAKDHPLYSRVYVEEQAAYYKSIYGKDFDMMKVAMLDHSRVINTDLRAAAKSNDRQALLQNIISTVDCMGVSHIDKISPIFKDPYILDLLQKMHITSKVETENVEKKRKDLKKKMITYIKQKNDLSAKHKELYIKSLNNTFDEQSVKFAVNYAFGSHSLQPIGLRLGDKKVVISQQLNGNMLEAVNENFGPETAFNNIEKILEDYGGYDKKNDELMTEKRIEVAGKKYPLRKLRDVFLNTEAGTTITVDAPHATFEFKKENNTDLQPLVVQVARNGNATTDLQSSKK